jgi:molybdate transport system permease protein
VRKASAALAALLLALLALPVMALFLRRPPQELLARIASPVVLDALLLSLLTSLLATVVVLVLGLPTAWLLATRTFPGKRIVETLVELPMVLPPTVAGFALLLAFGRAGLLGKALTAAGIQLPFTTAAVVVAQAFMAAPFFVLSARAGIESVDRRYLDAAATLRAGEFRTLVTVVLPLAAPALVSGLAMACARALGEFGATITFAGNLPGVTQTMPLAVYVALQTDLDAAITLSVILVALSFGLLLGLRGAGTGLFAARGHARREA